uniref:Uncharacterized protein n=1 Tax=Opuntia streptacantha TaxID=393608 RepID=A0A7C9DK64_OPUST
MPSLARRCPNYISLISFCLDRSGVNLPCSVMDCSSLGRCPTFVKPQWLIRTLTVSSLKPSPCFVYDLIAHLGFVGVALGTSIVVLQVKDSPHFRFGIQIRLRIWNHLCLYSSIGKILALARFVGLAADSTLMALLYHLQRGSYFFMVHMLPAEWALPTVMLPISIVQPQSKLLPSVSI